MLEGGIWLRKYRAFSFLKHGESNPLTAVMHLAQVASEHNALNKLRELKIMWFVVQYIKRASANT